MTHLEREIREQPEVLARIVDDRRLEQIGASLRAQDPSVVLTFARGSSDNAVTMFGYLVGLYLGIPVASVPPSLATLHGTTFRTGRALAVGVSQSGESQDVVQALRAVAGPDVTTLAVVNAEDSSLEATAHHTVHLRAGVERSVAASKTFTAQVMALARVVAVWSGDAALADALRAVPDAIQKVLEDTTAIDAAAARLTHADRLDVLGRGLTFGAALEAALKIKETCYLHAHAYSSAEFQHGPIASLGPGDPVVLLALSDVSLDGNLSTANRLRALGADVTIVSSDERLLSAASCSIAVPRGLAPVTETFAHLVVGQWLSLALARQRGLDPDAPRHLHKVTQTT